ncbi:MarR family transcriptional regulator [Microtetraspora malaysiensis]|uniref:MarR family transcriptional regulator n=1 Tax=Microtetraspora malaysiensis TaxID=161358 RepID=UPI001C3F3A93|nr:MarR family transcriptional regulator [Microtetraspora malaysiensis]
MHNEELLATAAELRRSSTRLSRRLRAERHGDGVGALGFSLLGRLYRHGPMTAGELAESERLQPQSLTRTLATLEEKRLVTRSRASGDRRRHQIALTEEGADVLMRYAQESDAWLAQRMARELTPTERGLLRLAAGLLDRLVSGDGEGREADGSS